MSIKEIVSETEKDFAEIVPGASRQVIQQQLRSVQRNIRRLSMLLNDRKTALLKISADLSSLLTSQLAFIQMNRPQNANSGFDESFFRSLGILKKELFEMIEGADK